MQLRAGAEPQLLAGAGAAGEGVRADAALQAGAVGPAEDQSRGRRHGRHAGEAGACGVASSKPSAVERILFA